MKTLLFTFLIYASIYLAISFIGLELDFKKWDTELRYWFVLLPLFYPIGKIIFKLQK